jgi:hypothetical protein
LLSALKSAPFFLKKEVSFENLEIGGELSFSQKERVWKKRGRFSGLPVRAGALRSPLSCELSGLSC